MSNTRPTRRETWVHDPGAHGALDRVMIFYMRMRQAFFCGKIFLQSTFWDFFAFCSFFLHCTSARPLARRRAPRGEARFSRFSRHGRPLETRRLPLPRRFRSLARSEARRRLDADRQKSRRAAASAERESRRFAAATGASGARGLLGSGDQSIFSVVSVVSVT